MDASAASRASAAYGIRSRSAPVPHTTTTPSPTATHGTASLTLSRATGGAIGSSVGTPTSSGRSSSRQRSSRSAPSVLSGWRGAPGVRWAVTASTTRAKASGVGSSPCSIWNASRSWAPTPTSSRAVPVIGSSTTLHTSRPRTSPASTPCSTTGTAPPASISGRKRSCSGDASDGGVSGSGTAGSRVRPSACQTDTGSENCVARRARVPVPDSATTWRVPAPARNAQASAAPRRRAGRSSR